MSKEVTSTAHEAQYIEVVVNRLADVNYDGVGQLNFLVIQCSLLQELIFLGRDPGVSNAQLALRVCYQPNAKSHNSEMW